MIADRRAPIKRRRNGLDELRPVAGGMLPQTKGVCRQGAFLAGMDAFFIVPSGRSAKDYAQAMKQGTPDKRPPRRRGRRTALCAPRVTTRLADRALRVPDFCIARGFAATDQQPQAACADDQAPSAQPPQATGFSRPRFCRCFNELYFDVRTAAPWTCHTRSSFATLR